MTILDIPVKTLAGQDSSLGAAAPSGSLLLVVNVASRCGLTPQYTVLEKLHSQFAGRGFSVAGFPCNQFGGQEPGTAEEIAEFCSATYGVTFPMFEKIEVNGPGRHAVYASLTQAPDASGQAGDVMWNFEKFLVRPDGTVAARFRPRTTPDAPEVLAAIEANLPPATAPAERAAWVGPCAASEPGRPAMLDPNSHSRRRSAGGGLSRNHGDVTSWWSGQQQCHIAVVSGRARR